MNQMSRCALLALVVAMLLPEWPAALVAGDLDNVREAAEESTSNQGGSNSSSRRRKSRHDDHCDDDNSFTGWLIGEIFGPPILFALASPWWGPAAMLGDEYNADVEFPHYPYAEGSDGYLVIAPEDLASDDGFGARYSTEYGNDFSGLERIGGRLQLETQSRFGVDTEWNHWREAIPGGHDELWTGDANLVFRFAQSEKVQFYSGLGLNWLGGEQSDVGFNFTYGVDWFPTDPFVIRSVLDAGTLGNADLYHSKTTIGLVYKHLELYAGYDILHIGETNLQGVIGGFTIWW